MQPIKLSIEEQQKISMLFDTTFEEEARDEFSSENNPIVGISSVEIGNHRVQEKTVIYPLNNENYIVPKRLAVNKSDHLSD